MLTTYYCTVLGVEDTAVNRVGKPLQNPAFVELAFHCMQLAQFSALGTLVPEKCWSYPGSSVSGGGSELGGSDPAKVARVFCRFVGFLLSFLSYGGVAIAAAAAATSAWQ